MSPTTQGMLVLAVTLVMLLSGAPVAFGLGAISMIFIVIFQGFDALHVVAETFWAGLNDFTLVSIPMFVMMGSAIGSSPAGKDLYEALDRESSQRMCATRRCHAFRKHIVRQDVDDSLRQAALVVWMPHDARVAIMHNRAHSTHVRRNHRYPGGLSLDQTHRGPLVVRRQHHNVACEAHRWHIAAKTNPRQTLAQCLRISGGAQLNAKLPVSRDDEMRRRVLGDEPGDAQKSIDSLDRHEPGHKGNDLDFVWYSQLTSKLAALEFTRGRLNRERPKVKTKRHDLESVRGRHSEARQLIANLLGNGDQPISASSKNPLDDRVEASGMRIEIAGQRMTMKSVDQHALMAPKGYKGAQAPKCARLCRVGMDDPWAGSSQLEHKSEQGTQIMQAGISMKRVDQHRLHAEFIGKVIHTALLGPLVPTNKARAIAAWLEHTSERDGLDGRPANVQAGNDPCYSYGGRRCPIAGSAHPRIVCSGRGLLLASEGSRGSPRVSGDEW